MLYNPTNHYTILYYSNVSAAREIWDDVSHRPQVTQIQCTRVAREKVTSASPTHGSHIEVTSTSDNLFGS